MFRKWLLPVAAGGLFIYLVSMFLFGELGVIRSYDKAVKISRLRSSIARLESVYRSKAEVLKKVRRNPSLAGRYRPWQGYRYREAGRQAFSRPFLLRHPMLLVLLGAIAIITGLFFLQQRKRGRDRGGRSAGSGKLVRSSGYIKPSWS